MAEAIVNSEMNKHWIAVSAGTKPAGYVHRKAVAVLNEIGIDHQGESKHAAEFQDWDLDLVITVCDAADKECPIWFGRGNRIHFAFPDPAMAMGTNEEIMDVFRSVRDDILRIVPKLIKEFE